jgi:hypothetical protein
VTRLWAGRPRNGGSFPGRDRRFSICEFSASRSGVAEDSVFPGCVAASLCIRFPTFPDSDVALSSKVKMSVLVGSFGRLKMRPVRCLETSGIDYSVSGP